MKLLLLLLFFARVISAFAQKGFLNIACGSKRNFTDERGLLWVPDAPYIRSGVAESADSSELYNRNLRRFPKPLNKSCYEIPVSPFQRYRLSLSFNTNVSWFDPFNYSVEAEDMLYLSYSAVKRDPDHPFVPYEQVLVTSGTTVYVCLCRLSGDPSISAIQLVQLQHQMYSWAKPGTLLALWNRADMSDHEGDPSVRYPSDVFDRKWNAAEFSFLPRESTNHMISAISSFNHPPSVVMQTVQPYTDPFDLFELKARSIVLLLLYVSHINRSRRSITVNISYEDTTKTLTLPRIYTAGELNFTLVVPEDGTLQSSFHDVPLNAFEYFYIEDAKPRTSSIDVEVLNELRRTYGLDFSSWVSDPCFVVPWEGINCNETEVSHLDLAGRNLSGTIAQSIGRLRSLNYLNLSNNHLEGVLPDFSNLTMLETLDVSNNKLNGSLPKWLSELRNLKSLFIQHNDFSGLVDEKLMKLSNISYSGNGNLIPSSKSHGVVIGAAIGAVVLLLVILTLAVVLLSPDKKKEPVKRMDKKFKSKLEILKSSNARSFSLAEMISATQDFSREIGRGGFGSVFYGNLPQVGEIAVKVLSAFSRQGKPEFLNELLLLSRLNHQNLVKLIGYCDDADELMLVYEYMSHGSLKDYLYGHEHTNLSLNWKSRLNIAWGAAQGLEYLHVHCKPKILHRDLKSANILIDKNLKGKLSDLGISKDVLDEATHVTTTVKGTAGYLDPEYFSTHMLTEKSDLYSFGVVLLEIVCGRQPLDPRLSEEQIHLIKWVKPYVEMGDPEQLRLIMDWRLKGKFRSIKSVAMVCELAMQCVRQEQQSRPSTTEAVQRLKEAMEVEKKALQEDVEAEMHSSSMSVHSSAPRDDDSLPSSFSQEPPA